MNINSLPPIFTFSQDVMAGNNYDVCKQKNHQTIYCLVVPYYITAVAAVFVSEPLSFQDSDPAAVPQEAIISANGFKS